MAPSAAVIHRVMEEAAFPQSQRAVCSQRIDTWRAFLSGQPQNWPSAEARTHLIPVANTLLELFPNAWSDSLFTTQEPTMLIDRLKTFMEYAVPVKSQYENLEWEVFVDVMRSQKQIGQHAPTEPTIYVCKDPDMPAFWGKPVPHKVVEEAIAAGMIDTSFGCGFVELMGRQVAVTNEKDAGPPPGFGPPMPRDRDDMDKLSEGGGVRMPAGSRSSYMDPMAKFGFVSTGPVQEDHQRLAETVLTTCGRLRMTLESYVSREAKDLLSASELIDLLRLAKIGDAVVEKAGTEGWTKEALLKDDVLEIACSAISTKLLGVLTKNMQGAQAMDVMGSAYGGLLGEKELERATKLAKDHYKLNQYVGNGAARSSSAPLFAGGRGRGDGGGRKGKGKGGKGGWLSCDVCGGGHVARYCPEVLNLIAKNSEKAKKNSNQNNTDTGAGNAPGRGG